jgi:hypothetical protein
MELLSEDEEKKMETPLSSNEIRQEAKAPWDTFLVIVAQKEKESTDSSDSVSERKLSYPIINKFYYFMYIKFK